MSIRTDDPRPPYVQLAAELRAAIMRGEFTPGQRLPSTRDLAEEYGIAPMTVQSALRVLREEGLVVAHQGRGVFVQEPLDQSTHGVPTDPTEVAEELRSIQSSLRDLDGRLARVEGLSHKTGPNNPFQSRRPANEVVELCPCRAQQVENVLPI